jgi:hypothetical protein
MLVRAKKLIEHCAARGGFPAHLPFEHPRGATARFFSAVEGKICARDEFFWVAAVLRSEGKPDAKAELEDIPPDLKRCLERRQQGGRIGLRYRGVANAGEENGELMAAKPRYGKISVQHRRETDCGGLQDRIARRVSQGVVDIFKAINVDEQHRRSRFPLKHIGEQIFEMMAIAKTGQRVVRCQPKEALVALFSL